MKNKLLILIATVLIAASPLFAGNGPIIEKAENPATEQPHCGVYDDQIKQYMLGYGKIIIEISGIEGQCDVIAYSIDEKRYIVHIAEGQIVGWDETGY